MDEDLFGTSVWTTTTTSTPSTSKLPQEDDDPFIIPIQERGFERNDPFSFNDDDFDPSEPIAASTSPFQTDITTFGLPVAEDDDFGDFGGADFDNQVAEENVAENQFQNLTGWKPLELNPFPDIEELQDYVASLMQPVWGDWTSYTKEPIRESEGKSKTLINPTSRALYQTLLTSSPPIPLPPSWTRSRIRRQYLISLGIPVNLDEVMPSLPNGKALPRLEVTTRPASAPPGPRKHEKVKSNGGGSRGPATPVTGPSLPPFDRTKIDAILGISSETIPLLPLSVLEAHLASLSEARESTTAYLTELLQKRESLRQDNETYNGLIAELVGEAQKRKMTKAKGRTSNVRRR